MRFFRTNSEAFTALQCAYCGGDTWVAGLLRRCLKCKGAWWNNAVSKRLSKHWSKKYCKVQGKCDKQVPFVVMLEEASVSDTSGESYVYVLEVDGNSKYNYYVGRTNHHPLKRLLNHVRGHKSASKIRNQVVGLYSWEGPMDYQASIDREVELKREMEMSGDWGLIDGPRTD